MLATLPLEFAVHLATWKWRLQRKVVLKDLLVRATRSNSMSGKGFVWSLLLRMTCQTVEHCRTQSAELLRSYKRHGTSQFEAKQRKHTDPATKIESRCKAAPTSSPDCWLCQFCPRWRSKKLTKGPDCPEHIASQAVAVVSQKLASAQTWPAWGPACTTKIYQSIKSIYSGMFMNVPSFGSMGCLAFVPYLVQSARTWHRFEWSGGLVSPKRMSH